jgi:predicted Zn-dependent protease with MMP-like domain
LNVAKGWHLSRGALARTLGASALPYGYTLTIWSSGAMLMHYRGAPAVWEILLFVAGAIVAFGLLGAIGRPRASPKAPPGGPSERVEAGVLHWLALGVALGGAILIAQVRSWIAWPLGSFAATCLFLLLASVELAFASKIESGSGPADQRTAEGDTRVSYARDDREAVSEPRHYTEQEFEALVSSALDELPTEFQRALEHVAIVVSDRGAENQAYGLYVGSRSSGTRFFGGGGLPDEILIFRDMLVRDFGADPDRLRAHVIQTVRHEVAHHLGFDEAGVRKLGL